MLNLTSKRILLSLILMILFLNTTYMQPDSDSMLSAKSLLQKDFELCFEELLRYQMQAEGYFDKLCDIRKQSLRPTNYYSYNTPWTGYNGELLLWNNQGVLLAGDNNSGKSSFAYVALTENPNQWKLASSISTRIKLLRNKNHPNIYLFGQTNWFRPDRVDLMPAIYSSLFGQTDLKPEKFIDKIVIKWVIDFDGLFINTIKGLFYEYIFDSDSDDLKIRVINATSNIPRRSFQDYKFLLEQVTRILKQDYKLTLCA